MTCAANAPFDSALPPLLVDPEQRPTLSAAEAAQAFGVSLDAWYASIRAEQCPLGVLRVGRRLIRHSTAEARQVLGLGPIRGEAAALADITDLPPRTLGRTARGR